MALWDLVGGYIKGRDPAGNRVSSAEAGSAWSRAEKQAKGNQKARDDWAAMARSWFEQAKAGNISPLDINQANQMANAWTPTGADQKSFFDLLNKARELSRSKASTGKPVEVAQAMYPSMK